MLWTILLGAVVVVVTVVVRTALGQRPKYEVPDSDETVRLARDCVYVNLDGSVRELSPGEKEYVHAEYPIGDSGRPYIKQRYDDKDGWGSMSGFLERDRLPEGVEVLPVHPDYDARVEADRDGRDPLEFVRGGEKAHFEQLRREEEFARIDDRRG